MTTGDVSTVDFACRRSCHVGTHGKWRRRSASNSKTAKTRQIRKKAAARSQTILKTELLAVAGVVVLGALASLAPQSRSVVSFGPKKQFDLAPTTAQLPAPQPNVKLPAQDAPAFSPDSPAFGNSPTDIEILGQCLQTQGRNAPHDAFMQKYEGGRRLQEFPKQCVDVVLRLLSLLIAFGNTCAAPTSTLASPRTVPETAASPGPLNASLVMQLGGGFFLLIGCLACFVKITTLSCGFVRTVCETIVSSRRETRSQSPQHLSDFLNPPAQQISPYSYNIPGAPPPPYPNGPPPPYDPRGPPPVYSETALMLVGAPALTDGSAPPPYPEPIGPPFEPSVQVVFIDD
eukprot:GHVT01054812.1.p1 GENE.GHVT01054812.1~~GHVT01054812.1.p1  ORF type:complete len:345 (-),score=40.47 GHVT01054812.1:699-1733(-)